MVAIEKSPGIEEVREAFDACKVTAIHPFCMWVNATIRANQGEKKLHHLVELMQQADALSRVHYNEQVLEAHLEQVVSSNVYFYTDNETDGFAPDDVLRVVSEVGAKARKCCDVNVTLAGLVSFPANSPMESDTFDCSHLKNWQDCARRILESLGLSVPSNVTRSQIAARIMPLLWPRRRQNSNVTQAEVKDMRANLEAQPAWDDPALLTEGKLAMHTAAQESTVDKLWARNLLDTGVELNHRQIRLFKPANFIVHACDKCEELHATLYKTDEERKRKRPRFTIQASDKPSE